jgi:hypothetical protein
MSPSFASQQDGLSSVLERACGAIMDGPPARTDRHSPFNYRPTFSPIVLVTAAFADLRQTQVVQHSITQSIGRCPPAV